MKPSITHFELIIECFIEGLRITGDFKEVRQRFKELPKRDRHSFLKLTSKGIWETRLTTESTNKLTELLK